MSALPRHVTPFERFRVGDTVAHITGGDATVIENDGAAVTVRFARRCRPNVGIYDAPWFAAHPRHLFHRRPAP